MDFFYAACLLGIHHLTLWQRTYEPGRTGGAGWRQMHPAIAGCAPVFERQVRPDPAPELQVHLRL